MLYIPIGKRNQFVVSCNTFGFVENPPEEEGIVMKAIISAALFLKQNSRNTFLDSFPKVTIEVKKSVPRLEVDAGSCNFSCSYCQMRHHPEYTPLKWSLEDFNAAVSYLHLLGTPYSVSIARKEMSDKVRLQNDLASTFLDIQPVSVRYFSNGSGFGTHIQPLLKFIYDKRVPYNLFWAVLVSKSDSQLISKGHFNLLSQKYLIEDRVRALSLYGIVPTIVLLTNPFELPDVEKVIEELKLLKEIMPSIGFSFDIISFLDASYRDALDNFRNWSQRILEDDISNSFMDVYGQFGTLRNFFWPYAFLPKSVNAGSHRVLVGNGRMSIEHHPEEPVNMEKVASYRPEEFIVCKNCQNYQSMPHGCIERIRNNQCFWFFPRCENCLASLQCNARKEAACLTEQDCWGAQMSIEFLFKLGLKNCDFDVKRVMEVLTHGQTKRGIPVYQGPPTRGFLPGKPSFVSEGISG